MSEKVITVGLDIGHINYKGLSADLIIPGAKSRLLDPLGKETIGAFIIANKHDLPDALELDTIKKRRLEPIIPVSVTKEEGLNRTLDTLFELICRVWGVPN